MSAPAWLQGKCCGYDCDQAATREVVFADAEPGPGFTLSMLVCDSEQHLNGAVLMQLGPVVTLRRLGPR